MRDSPAQLIDLVLNRDLLVTRQLLYTTEPSGLYSSVSLCSGDVHVGNNCSCFFFFIAGTVQTKGKWDLLSRSSAWSVEGYTELIMLSTEGIHHSLYASLLPLSFPTMDTRYNVSSALLTTLDDSILWWLAIPSKIFSWSLSKSYFLNMVHVILK